MKKAILVILAVLAVLAVSLSGCYEVKNTTVVNNYYGDSNSVLAEKDSIESDPNQYEIITLSFEDSFNFGDLNRSPKRARQIQDVISLLVNTQAKKVSYIEGCFYASNPYRQYEFRIEPNESKSVRLAIGDYFVEADAYGEIADKCFHLFSGERNISINKGPNDCLITMVLHHFQPVMISLPENGMIDSESYLQVNGEREDGNSFTSHLYPLEANNNRLIGIIPIDLKLMTILYEDYVYNFGPEIFDATILDDVLFLDDYKPEKATSAKMEFQLVGRKLIAGARGVVMMMKLEGVGDKNTINSIWLNGAENDIEEVIVLEGDTELGSSNIIENNIAKIDLLSPIEFLKEEKIVLVMEALVSPTAIIGNQISFGLEAFIGSLTFKMDQVCPEFTIIDKGSMFIGYSRLYNPLSSHIILSESTENDLEYIELEPRHEDVELESFTINVKDGDYCGNVVGSYMDIKSVSIYDRYMKVAEKDIHSPVTTIDFRDLVVHQPGDSWGKMLTLKVNGSEIGNGGLGTPNADVKIVISNIKARGLLSGQYVNIIEGNLESDLIILRKSRVWIKTPASHDPIGASTSLINGDNIIYVAEIHSEGGNSLTYKQSYGVFVGNEISISDPYLTDQNGNIVSVSKWTGKQQSGSYSVVFYLDNPDFDSGLEREAIEIPGYSSRSFYLHTFVSGAKKGSVISCYINGDYTTNYCSPMSTADEVEGYFVWSDNHKELSISNGDAINAPQWYNGDFIYSNYLYYISY